MIHSFHLKASNTILKNIEERMYNKYGINFFVRNRIHLLVRVPIYSKANILFQILKQTRDIK